MRAKTIITFFLYALTYPCLAQRIVFDRNHFNIVNENGAMRSAAETAHQADLEKVSNRLDDINMNLSAVVLVQQMVFQSLTQVNQALKSGLTVRQIVQVNNEIIVESNRMTEAAAGEPWLLLFTEDVARQVKTRAVGLAGEVSAFVLKGGQNVLMDFERRDALLLKILLELRVIRALTYSMYRSVYWAKLNGVLKTVNPYRSFINQDLRLADEVIYQYNNLKR